MIRRRIELENTEQKQEEARRFNRRLKLSLLVLTLIGVFISSTFFWSTWTRQNQLIESRLETFTELRHSVVKRFLSSLAQETELWSGDKNIADKAQDYFELWNAMTTDERKALREGFVNRDPIISGSKVIEAYTALHAETHPTLEAFEKHHGYYDIFLFNLEGDLVYSVEKEADFGLNYAKDGGVYAASGLGTAFQKAVIQTPGQDAIFVDFSPYAPSNDDPAAFLSSPLINPQGTKIGVFAIQVPIDKFNAVMQYSSGLGETGETYIVGSDFLMRSQSRLTKVDGVLKHSVKTDAVTQVLRGQTVLVRGNNYVGKTTIISGMPLEFNNTNWAILTEMELSELRAPLRNYVVFYWLSIIFILGFGLLSYWLLFARPSRQKA